MSEKRQLPRFDVKKETKAWLPQMQEFRHCVIEDINLKGLRASFSKQLPQERPLRISLDIKDDYDFLKVEAHLPWVREVNGRYVYGMFFNRILDPDKDRIYQYIISHCSDQFKNKWYSDQQQAGLGT